MIDTIRAVAADIDMTLCSKGGDLPEATKEAFEILHEKGILIGLATGREITDKLKRTGENWGLSFEFDFVVGMNGGMVYDRRKEKMWSVDLLRTEELRELVDYLMPVIEKYVISVNAEGGDNHNAMNIRGELLESARRHGFDFVDVTGDVDAFCANPAYKILLRMKPEHEAELRSMILSQFGDRYQVVGTFPGTIEVLKRGINKGKGLEKLASWENLDMKDIITFGDNENDEPMLMASGWGVCLKDGSKQTQTCADAVTEYDCIEGGVGRYLMDHYIVPKGWK